MENRRQAEQEAARWIGQREAGPWTESDAVAFEAWLNESMSHRAAYYRFNTAWKETGRLNALGRDAYTGSPLSVSFDERKGEKGPKTPTRARVALVTIAAGLAVILIGALFTSHERIFDRDTYTTPVGGLATVPMSDGSRVTLNTDSKLRIKVDEKQRFIELEQGEAFFEVAKDPARPFIVQAGNRAVTAIGTQFSVRRERNDIRVVVTEGTVKMAALESVISAGSDAKISQAAPKVASGSSANDGKNHDLVIAAGTAARVQGDDVLLQTKTMPEIEQRLSWRTGVLTFRNTRLADAIAEFNRYNPQQIIIQDQKIAEVRIGGIFRTTNLQSFIQLIEVDLDVRTRQKGNNIILSAE